MRRAGRTTHSAAQRVNGRMAAAVMTAAIAATGMTASAAAAAGTTTLSPAAAYAKSCKNQSRHRLPGLKASSYSRCVTAMARLAQAKSRSPLVACATLSRKRIAGTRSTAFSRCLAAGRALTRLGNGIDLYFVEQMTMHHESAVQMAEYAATHAESDYLRTLAANIISTQTVEIATMRQIAAQLRAAGIRPVPLGLTIEQMGMNHDMSHIIDAHPFDVVFVDMMIPHHQGAITMSKVLFARGTGVRTRALAEQITAAQTREIQEMQEFRLQSTGAAAPAPGESSGHPH
jgi:uncharacterized protein (DUF305 family)